MGEWHPFDSKILTLVTFLKRHPSEIFASVDKLAGNCARVDGVEEDARVREAGGKFLDSDLSIHFLYLIISVVARPRGGRRDGVVVAGGAR